jgi:YesN/AraC family two-component response regulator
MKYKIIVADDEPTASQFICALIEKRTNDFEIVATAENGQVCLNLVEAYQPDVVITDIKMPVMDGIELIRQLNIDHPTVLTILISGYEEFQYARAALKYNAVDYIKKPVTPRIFSETMASVKTRLDQMFYEERNHAIRNLSKGIPVGERLLQKYFPDGPYYAVLMRRNGLPRRFSGNKAVEVFSEAYESIIVYGRDEMESLYLIANSLLVGFEETMTLDQYIRKLLTQERTAAYATVISSREPIEFSRFGEKIQPLSQTLDLKTVIGKNQNLFLEECLESPSKAWSSGQQFQKLEYYMAQHQREKIKSELRALFDEWEQQCLPQIQVEELVNHIIYLFRSHGEGIDMDCSIDFQLEDAFSTAPNMTMLEETIETILFENCGDKITPGCGKIDTPEFLTLFVARSQQT